MRCCCVCLLVASANGDSTFAQESQKPPSAAAINKWILELDSRSFKARQNAESQLLRIGSHAVPVLSNVIATSKSLELVERSKRIIAQIRQNALDRITQEARLATAVIEAPTSRGGFRPAGIAAARIAPTNLATAVCIHPAGVFVTSYSAVRYVKSQSIPLVVHPGTPKQTVLKAAVVRSDTRINLALLQVQTKDDLPYAKLGSTKGISELVKVIALGCHGQKVELNGKPQYPAVRTDPGFVSSIVVDAGSLNQLLIDTGQQTGAIGGPILNDKGQVIAVYAALSASRSPFSPTSVPSDTAIPVEALKGLMEQPIVQFIAPTLNLETVGQPCEFRARIIHFGAVEKTPDLELMLVANGIVRRHKLKHEAGVYKATAIPVPTAKQPADVRVRVAFSDGLITANIKDSTIRIGDRDVRLSEIRSLEIKAKSVAGVLADGTKIEGALSRDASLDVVIGAAIRKVDLASAAGLVVERSVRFTQLTCRLVETEGGMDRVVWQGTLPIQQANKK